MTRQGNQVQLSFGSTDKLVRFWNVETGEQVGEINILQEDDGIPFGHGVEDVAFSVDWRLIATAGEDLIQLWSLQR